MRCCSSVGFCPMFLSSGLQRRTSSPPASSRPQSHRAASPPASSPPPSSPPAHQSISLSRPLDSTDFRVSCRFAPRTPRHVDRLQWSSEGGLRPHLGQKKALWKLHCVTVRSCSISWDRKEKKRNSCFHFPNPCAWFINRVTGFSRRSRVCECAGMQTAAAFLKTPHVGKFPKLTTKAALTSKPVGL